jgi:hypothetical protein
MMKLLVKYVRHVAAAALLMILAGCSSTSEPAMTVVLSQNDLNAVAWIDDGLVVEIRPGIGNDIQLARVRTDGSDFDLLELPNSECKQRAVSVPARLPDGRLGYLSDCAPSLDSSIVGVYMMAFDMETGQIERLTAFALPSSGIGTGSNMQGWNPDMTKGISNRPIETLHQNLYWFTYDDWEEISIEGLEHTFGPAWSPDGEHIVFIGARTPAELDSPLPDYHFYLMEPDGSNVHRLIDEVVDTTNAVWSPDSRWLAFAGTIRGWLKDEEGIWIINFETRDLIYIAEGNFQSVVWSPDGMSLAAVQLFGMNYSLPRNVVTFDVSELVDAAD